MKETRPLMPASWQNDIISTRPNGTSDPDTLMSPDTNELVALTERRAEVLTTIEAAASRAESVGELLWALRVATESRYDIPSYVAAALRRAEIETCARDALTTAGVTVNVTIAQSIASDFVDAVTMGKDAFAAAEETVKRYVESRCLIVSAEGKALAAAALARAAEMAGA